MMRVFQQASVKGPFTMDDGQTVYSIEALWRDGSTNIRAGYSQIAGVANDYPQMQADFAAWPDANGAYPDHAAYAVQAHWTT